MWVRCFRYILGSLRLGVDLGKKQGSCISVPRRQLAPSKALIKRRCRPLLFDASRPLFASSTGRFPYSKNNALST